MLKMLHALPVLLLCTGAAQAQSQCGTRQMVMDTLANRYGESRQAIGLAVNSTVMEMFASENGSWTITVTMPDGMVCLLASSENFEALREPMPAKGDPA